MPQNNIKLAAPEIKSDIWLWKMINYLINHLFNELINTRLLKLPIPGALHTSSTHAGGIFCEKMDPKIDFLTEIAIKENLTV